MKTKLKLFLSNHSKLLKISIVFTLLGFMCSLLYFLDLSPLSFLIFSVAGIAFFGLGILFFFWIIYDEFIKEHSLFKERHYSANSVVIHEGEMGEEMYFISKGRVAVLKKQDDQDEFVAELEEGEYFGEMALLGDGRRTATVKAITDLKVISVGRKNFSSLIRNLPKLSDEIKKTTQKRKMANSEIE